MGVFRPAAKGMLAILRALQFKVPKSIENLHPHCQQKTAVAFAGQKSPAGGHTATVNKRKLLNHYLEKSKFGMPGCSAHQPLRHHSRKLNWIDIAPNEQIEAVRHDCHLFGCTLQHFCKGANAGDH
jgi:hypothetical protein